MVVCIHWFNPLVYVMYRFINKDLELACDEQAIRRMGREKRASYALSLIHLASGKQQGMALVSGFGKNDIEERVVCIMSKKNKSKVFSAVIVSLGVLSGSVLATTLPAQKGEQAGLSEAVQEEHMAYANVEDRQAENSLVKAKNSQQGEALRESWYRDYEVYGMTYDAAKDAFYYNGKVVRAFLDKVSDKGWRMFVRNNQGILVKAVRNGQNKLIGLKQLQGAEEIQLLQEMGIGNDKACDDKDYDEECDDEEWEEEEIISQKAAEKVKTFLKNEKARKSPTYAQDNPKAEYKAYGVSYNAEKKAWEWNGKVIRFLWDENKHWHVNNSVEAIHNGVKVKVVRDAKGNITKLVEMSDKEYNEFKKSNAFLSKAL